MDPAREPPFFSAGAQRDFKNVPGTRYLLRRDGANLAGVLGGVLGNAGVASDWREKQDTLIKWTRDPVMFNEADVAQNFALYRRFFEDTRGPLAGRVLDIGGGWGLFRKWWRAEGDACFTVHDPGVERFTVEPPETLKRYFGDGLGKPAWFVEGVGEQLPFEDSSYDVVMIASAMDHCADPPRVLAEARRVLRLAGALLVIQGFDRVAGQPKPEGRSFFARLGRLLADPRRLHRAIRQRLFHRGEPHMHHFTQASLRAMIEASGFRSKSETVISERFGVLAIEARKTG